MNEYDSLQSHARSRVAARRGTARHGATRLATIRLCAGKRRRRGATTTVSASDDGPRAAAAVFAGSVGDFSVISSKMAGIGHEYRRRRQSPVGAPRGRSRETVDCECSYGRRRPATRFRRTSRSRTSAEWSVSCFVRSTVSVPVFLLLTTLSSLPRLPYYVYLFIS